MRKELDLELNETVDAWLISWSKPFFFFSHTLKKPGTVVQMHQKERGLF
jgi:hypothetical protein